MKTLAHAVVLIGLGSVLVGSATVSAHHSVGATFDAEKTVSFEGTVSKVDWFNPHIWIYLNVKATDGSSAEYQCEGSSPNSLRRRGWSKDSLQPGDMVTVEGLQARNDPFSCYAQSIKLADGTRLFSGNAAELGQ